MCACRTYAAFWSEAAAGGCIVATDMASLELRPASYVVLGMLSIGSRSGYEIRSSAELSLRFFWAISPVQIYPELRRLEEGGLVEGRDEPRGGRARRLFELTAAGEQALRAWLAADEDLGEFEWRDVGLLKLFFADGMEPDDVERHLRRMRDRAEAYVARLEREIIPAGDKTRERHDKQYPVTVAEFARDFHAWMSTWCERFADEVADRGAPVRRRRQ